MALNFKQEINLFLDLYLWNTEYTILKGTMDKDSDFTWSTFYGNRYVLYNEYLINYNKTKEFIEVLETTDISKGLKEILLEEWVSRKLTDFKRYAKIWKEDYVAVWSLWIWLKLYKSIYSMLEEFDDITVKEASMLTFYHKDQPLIIVAPYKIDAQTNLFNEE